MITKNIKIAIFLNKYKELLLNKTDIYNNYFDKEGNIDIDYINNLTSSEIEELYNTIENEKTYL